MRKTERIPAMMHLARVHKGRVSTRSHLPGPRGRGDLLRDPHEVIDERRLTISAPPKELQNFVQFNVVRPKRRGKTYWFDRDTLLQAKCAFYLKQICGMPVLVAGISGFRRALPARGNKSAAHPKVGGPSLLRGSSPKTFSMSTGTCSVGSACGEPRSAA
jgi:hypothetical protein